MMWLILRGTTLAGFSGQFFHIFEIKLFCFVVAMNDVVQDVEAIHSVPFQYFGNGGGAL